MIFLYLYCLNHQSSIQTTHSYYSLQQLLQIIGNGDFQFTSLCVEGSKCIILGQHTVLFITLYIAIGIQNGSQFCNFAKADDIAVHALKEAFVKPVELCQYALVFSSLSSEVSGAAARADLYSCNKSAKACASPSYRREMMPRFLICSSLNLRYALSICVNAFLASTNRISSFLAVCAFAL